MNKKFWQTFKPFSSSKDITSEKMIIQYTPDNSNLQGTDENGSS